MTTAGDQLQRARELVPAIAAAADQIERERRLPAPLVTTLHEQGFFRLLLPRALGGVELDPATFVQITEAIASADASAAWVVCQTTGCSMVSAYLAPDVAREVFGDGGVLAWGPPERSRAVAVDGGYRLSGRFNFASGSRHATWLGGQAPIVEAGGTPRWRDGVAERRTLLFPASRAVMEDVWHVIGLRGTGSDSFTVDDVFVPHAHTLTRDDAAARRVQAPLYCFPQGSLYASGFAGVAMGIARTMLDDFLALARDKTPRGYSRTLRESAVTQSRVAQAEARLGAARSIRTGMGYDVHRLGADEELWLCGVRIPHDRGLAGHSDADVAIHALVDALLGALAEGDIGSHFPPSDPQWRGAASSRFLDYAAQRVAKRDGFIEHVDLTLICEAPKIGPHRDAMRARIAEILGLSLDRVSVKATTTERLGFAGRREGIAAQAVATLSLPALF
jgi:2-C-methyl-D-erythritol 2,4-cyclodiphosphate synthase